MLEALLTNSNEALRPSQDLRRPGFFYLPADFNSSIYFLISITMQPAINAFAQIAEDVLRDVINKTIPPNQRMCLVNIAILLNFFVL